MLHHSEDGFIKYHEQNLSIKFAFSMQHGTRLSIKQWKKTPFLECLIKIYFSTESAKEPTIYDFLILIALYSPKNDNKHPSEMSTTAVTSL